jgi:hypothetical protein
MSFKRDGKSASQKARDWQAWRDRYAKKLQQCGLPICLLRSKADWEYLLRYGYHCDGPYPNIDFNLDDMTEAQRIAFRSLLDEVLSEEEKSRGSAGWHFVCPP